MVGHNDDAPRRHGRPRSVLRCVAECLTWATPGSRPADPAQAWAGVTRRDAYEAHMMLSRLGLVTVTPDPGRNLDGKVEGYNDGERALLHAFSFHPNQFSREAPTEFCNQIDHQLNR
jgi:hypothetical protein